MIAQPPGVRSASAPPATPVVAFSPRGVLGFLTALIERAARAEANSFSESHSYWTSVARGL